MVKLISTLMAHYRAYIVYRDAVRELSNLSDRELQDIGISRCDIDSIAKQSCKQEFMTS